MQLKDWEAMREEIWPVDSNNSYSYLRLAAFTDDVAALPAGDIPVRHLYPPSPPFICSWPNKCRFFICLLAQLPLKKSNGTRQVAT
jgi:hypothetical protein